MRISSARRLVVVVAALGVTLANGACGPPHALAAEAGDDPLAPILAPVLRPAVESLLDRYRTRRAYRIEDFPMPAAEFADFRDDVVGRLTKSLGLDRWTVRLPSGKKSPIATLFRDRLLDTVTFHGVQLEVHVIEIVESGDLVPAVLALPPGEERSPAVAVFSGHSPNGLRDLVVDLESYQSGLATRLAQAGFATIAVEKIDAGYLSRTPPSGVDEREIASFRLGMGKPTRAVQLMAALAALEILAAHPRVDEARMGAAGVSLGGWLAVQTALLSDRVKAVADFGRKTVVVPDEMGVAQFQGALDLCHVLPGMLGVGDRNLLQLAYAPRLLMAGHGRQDWASQVQSRRYFRELYERQYRELGRVDALRYHVHDGGDTMPAATVIDYFAEVFTAGD